MPRPYSSLEDTGAIVAPSQAAMRRSLRGWAALPHVAGECLGRHEPPDRDREWAAQDHAVPVTNRTTGIGPETDDAGQVDRQREQHWGGGQQIHHEDSARANQLGNPLAWDF